MPRYRAIALRVTAPAVVAALGAYFGGIFLAFGLAATFVLLGYALLWLSGQEIRSFYYGKIAGRLVHIECTVCDATIDVPYTVSVDDNVISFIPDVVDVTAHQWAHDHNMS